jgi:hypothetical protein
MNAVESSSVINLVATDLFKSPVPEPEEENPGAFVHFNLDNDDNSNNSDGAPKHPGGDYIANETHGEDDLKRAKIFFGRQFGRLPNEGKVVLRVKLISGSRHMRVWKSPEKGAGNDVLVTVQEKGWDLSDPVQRQAFSQIKENLWIEGVEYNSKCWLEVEYKKQEGGEWKVVGSDRVKYTFIAADCGVQPRTEPCQLPVYDWQGKLVEYYDDPDQRARIKGLGVKDCEFSITDNRITLQYNCIAWSVDETNIWYEDIRRENVIYPPNVVIIDEVYGNGDRKLEIKEMDTFYRIKKGWTQITTGNDEQKAKNAEAIYYHNGYHAARRKHCPCGAGKWIMYESKCGRMERIEHIWNQLSCYGTPTHFYK